MCFVLPDSTAMRTDCWPNESAGPSPGPPAIAVIVAASAFPSSGAAAASTTFAPGLPRRVAVCILRSRVLIVSLP